MFRLLYLLLIFVCITPTIPGIAGVMTSAFGYIPPLNLFEFNLSGFAAVFNWSGVWQSIGLTIFTTLLSSFIAVITCFAILSSTWKSPLWQKVERSLSPLLAVPHVAFAIGLAFLLSPTGMLARLADPLLNNEVLKWLVQDPFGIGLILMLSLKETPFLLLMSIPILRQLNPEQSEKIANSLGYDRAAFWWKCLLPQWLAKIRFPLIAVVAYGASVVDVSLIIGPTNPPTFPVLVWQWFSEPDLTLFPRASAGAMILFILCSLLIAFARAAEWYLLKNKRNWQISGRSAPSLPGKTLWFAMALLFAAVFVVLAVWTLAQRWRFPDLVPSSFSLRFWASEWPGITPVILDSLYLAVISATAALIFALIAQEYRIRHSLALPRYLIAIPMLVPQLSLLFGIQVTTLYLNSEYYYFWVIWSHVFFAFPYVYLALDGPWSSFNQAYFHTALSLGKTPFTAWIKIKLPLLFSAILFSWAVGASVSLAQYLPTLMLGAGRISTLTTEAVALSSGFDRRVTSIYAIWQTLLPLLFFAAVIAINQIQIKTTKTKGSLVKYEPAAKEPHHL
ncbi:thiamine ABC transporter permease [Vibrio sp. JC009]|uniref:ABC transporter permease n=1 Tax=Vibrio sp. JC009 TaxID=2912314 RepID=UPI0023B081C5|nr:thiamine ABC transporter permease [Vibrio sp. JC009]WED20710.1 thiamine ABC transporter permease [Vibrio sp. JC009]